MNCERNRGRGRNWEVGWEGSRDRGKVGDFGGGGLGRIYLARVSVVGLI